MTFTLPSTDSKAVWQGRGNKPPTHRWPWQGSGGPTTTTWRPVQAPQKLSTQLHLGLGSQPTLSEDRQNEAPTVSHKSRSSSPRVAAGQQSRSNSQEVLRPVAVIAAEIAHGAEHSRSCTNQRPDEQNLEVSDTKVQDENLQLADEGQKTIETKNEALEGQEPQPGKEAGQHLLALIKHEIPDTVFGGQLQLNTTEAWWCWPQNQGWAWWDLTAANANATAETKPLKEGDETLLGPDGDLYDVFYPNVPDEAEKEEVSTACSEGPDTDGSNERDSIPFPVFSCRETSAEDGIADVVEFMRTAAVARYPARARFFQLVQEAAADALGQHFERLALVGSTALRIDTPDSDLDVVAFTRRVLKQGEEVPAPTPVESLRRIVQSLRARDSSLKLQLVDCSRVPVLTAVSADRLLSLDLTVDQPLGEWHVLWFQSLWQAESSRLPSPLHRVPLPAVDADGDTWEVGLEAAALRCVKWWLRRRRIPVSKEGGYPTVVWTLMVLHVLRCSLFLNNAVAKEDRARTLLGAIAAFFDRFSECRCGGTLRFHSGPDGMRSEFHQRSPQDRRYDFNGSHDYGELSVLDPTTTSEISAAWGIEPADLAPSLPQATRLLHAYELRRAQRLSAIALATTCEGPQPLGQANSAASGGAALQALFAEAGEAPNTLPTIVPTDPTGVFLFRDGLIHVGILKKVSPKPGWAAPFLHRRDNQSAIAVELCYVHDSIGALTTMPSCVSEHWFKPCDFICLATVIPVTTESTYRTGRQATQSEGQLRLDDGSLERWKDMRDLLTAGARTSNKAAPKNRSYQRPRREYRDHRDYRDYYRAYYH